MGGGGGGWMGMKALERKEVLWSGRGKVYGPCTHVRLIHTHTHTHTHTHILCVWTLYTCTPSTPYAPSLVQNLGSRILRLIDMEPNVLLPPSLRRSWTPKSAWRRSRQPSYSESTFDYMYNILFI
jgi:hypothetical protein